MTPYDEMETDRHPVLSMVLNVLLFLLVQGLAVMLVGVAALFLSFDRAWSAEGLDPHLRPGEARSGSLLLKTDDGDVDAIRLGIDVDLTVSGPTVRARVTQIFRNPTQDWMEATYVYPLPPGGAVDTLKMVVGDRVIIGDIKERLKARAVYERAKANGQRAALTAGTPQHLHQLGRQYRARRDRPGADRISGAGRAERQRIFAPRADGGGTTL